MHIVQVRTSFATTLVGPPERYLARNVVKGLLQVATEIQVLEGKGRQGQLTRCDGTKLRCDFIRVRHLKASL